MKGKQFLALMVAMAIGLLLIIMAQGCYSPKKAEKAVSKALAYYPEQTIGKVRILAPCVTLGSSFSTDSAAYKASLDSLYNSRGWYEQLIRGIESLPPHPTSQDTLCPELKKALDIAIQKNEYQEQYIIDITDQFNNVKPIIINRVDTFEDLSKVMAKDFELLEARKLYSQQTNELQKAKQERDKAISAKRKQIWWIVGEGLFIILLSIGLYLLIKSSATKKLL